MIRSSWVTGFTMVGLCIISPVSAAATEEVLKPLKILTLGKFEMTKLAVNHITNAWHSRWGRLARFGDVVDSQ